MDSDQINNIVTQDGFQVLKLLMKGRIGQITIAQLLSSDFIKIEIRVKAGTLGVPEGMLKSVMKEIIKQELKECLENIQKI